MLTLAPSNWAAPLHLGHLALRGESGVLRISPKSLLRMHWNPFYDYVESRILRFMDLPAAARK